MYKFILKITKKFMFFIIFFQQKKIFLLSIAFASIIIVGWHYLKNKQDFNINKYIYQKITPIIDSIKFYTLIDNNKKNVNYILDMMELSKILLEKNQIDQAIEKINNAIKKTKDNNLKSILNIRIARMYLQQKQSDLAIKHLDTINSDIWFPIKYNLIGDAMLIKKDINKAIEFWQKGIIYDKSYYLKDILQMKINNLQQ